MNSLLRQKKERKIHFADPFFDIYLDRCLGILFQLSTSTGSDERLIKSNLFNICIRDGISFFHILNEDTAPGASNDILFFM